MAEDQENRRDITEKVADGIKKTRKTMNWVNRIGRLLAVPILGQILTAIIVVIILAFIFVGIWNFFTAMPNMVRDKLAGIMRKYIYMAKL